MAHHLTRVVAISNPEGAPALFNRARNEGYITFVYRHADPHCELGLKKFLYVDTDAELVEKLDFIHSDITVFEEVLRW